MLIPAIFELKIFHIKSLYPKECNISFNLIIGCLNDGYDTLGFEIEFKNKQGFGLPTLDEIKYFNLFSSV